MHLRKASLRDWRSLVPEFKTVWENCAALHCLLLPDWSEFEKADRTLVDGDSSDRSMMLLAFERGHLQRLTGLVHRYLMDGNTPKSTVIKQYRQDLQEQWIYKDELPARHQKSRMFLGKLIELLVAQGLEESGIHIDGLAATGADYG